MITFSVPAMFCEEQIQKVIELNTNTQNNRCIRELYGSAPFSAVGSIRPAFSLPQIERVDFFKYIRQVTSKGLEFNYIMNSTVLDGSEYTNEGKKEIVDFVGEMVNAGLSGITITVPYLIRLIHKYYPDLKITASICAEVESVQRAIDFAEIGATCIVPAKDLNRDFKTLKYINKAFSGSIKLLATTPCLFKCSDLYYHMNLSSIQDNSLIESFKVKGKFLSHTTARCQRRRLENPVEYIRSPWIRPEDIHYYENIGIFDFKLDGRDRTMEYNNAVMEAYMLGEYSKNLLFLMQHYFVKDMEEYRLLDLPENDFWKLGVYLDNKKLDGFLKPFADGVLNCSEGCKGCTYCKSWSDKTITQHVANTNRYLDLLVNTESENLTV